MSDTKQSIERQLKNRVKALRQQRGWSQDDLARRAGVSRPAVSAIEVKRLVPSVAVAIALAKVFECKVEDLFFDESSASVEWMWAWPPPNDPCRFWRASVGNRTVLYPVEATVAGSIPHDGVCREGVLHPSRDVRPENTLVMASCDPAAGFLAAELARTSDFRLLVLPRASRASLDLLQKGLVHLAGLHLATPTESDANALAVKTILGPGHSLLAIANWQEGLSLGAGIPVESVKSILHSRLRWVGRETGSGARQCQDEVLEDRPLPRKVAKDHRGVAEAIRCGWADVGVCVRLVSEEAGLQFIEIRDETYEICYPTAFENDPRLRALLQVVRSRSYSDYLSELPGFDCGSLGETTRIE